MFRVIIFDVYGIYLFYQFFMISKFAILYEYILSNLFAIFEYALDNK